MTIQEQDKAIISHDTATDDIQIYTDGSGHNGQIGAGMVILEMGMTRKAYLGITGTSTVYAAELKGIVMALEAIQKYCQQQIPRSRNKWLGRGIRIYTDNQAALRALIRPRMVSGQTYLQKALDILEWCEDNITISFYWIPGHEGIDGNEAADKAAKEAAEHGYVRGRDRIYWLAAAAKQRVRHEVKIKWKRLWKQQKSAKSTKRIIEAPHAKNLQYWKSLRKATTSILIQLRTGIIGLSHYLSRIRVRDDARCECGLGSQTPHHVVLICPLLHDMRHRMWERLRDVGGLRLGTLDNLLKEKRAAIALADFMVDSGLLDQFKDVDKGAMGTTEQDAQ